MRVKAVQLSKILALVLVFAMVLTACAAPAAPAAPAAEAPAAEAPAAEAPAAESGFASEEVTISNAEWWQTAGQPYAGTTIRGISESTPPSRYAAETLAPKFAELTGINVEFEVTSWNEMYNKPIQDMQAGTGIYDFVYIEQDIIYSYLANDWFVNLTELLAANPDLQSPDFDMSKFTSFIDNFKDAEGNVYGIPMEAFIKVYLYRMDLFNDPAIQAAFEEQYGYPLAPASTIDEYRDIAEFFTAYGEENNLELWGTTNQASTGHEASTYETFETIFPLFGVYNWGIDQDTWKACEENGGRMNSQAAVDALQLRLDMLDFSPPESTSSTWSEVAATFAAGRAAQGFVYGENAAWIAADPAQSQVVGNVGVSPIPPLTEGVLEAAESGEGYVGYYDGGAFGIPFSSTNQEAALLWLQFVGLEEVQPQWAVAGSRIVMESTYDDPMIQELNSQVDNYYEKMREYGPLYRGAPPFPFHNQVRGAIDGAHWQALAGELTAKEALDQMCATAEATMAELGYGQ
jgi:multiple sugar transport system substrate-binding protein